MAAIGICAGSATAFARSPVAPATQHQQADVILPEIAGPGPGLLSHLPATAAVGDTTNVNTVLVNGQIRKRNGRLTARRESR
jgi:hypothetical protein